MACCDLGIAAVISFHRGDVPSRRAAISRRPSRTPKRLGHRHVGPLALARSLDREQAGALPEALAALTDCIQRQAEDLEEVEDLLADVVRLAIEVGDLASAHAFAARPLVSPPGQRSRTGRRTRSTVTAC